jgi:hypothetical protein
MFKVAEDVVAPAPSARVEHTTSRLKALWQKYGTPVLVVLLAVAVGDAIGRRVAFVDVPPEAFASALARAGVPQWQVDGLIEDYAHYARGEAVSVLPTVRDVTGREARSIAEFARDYAGGTSTRQRLPATRPSTWHARATR